jgi:hypothetical protein
MGQFRSVWGRVFVSTARKRIDSNNVVCGQRSPSLRAIVEQFRPYIWNTNIKFRCDDCCAGNKFTRKQSKDSYLPDRVCAGQLWNVLHVWHISNQLDLDFANQNRSSQSSGKRYKKD